MNDHGETSKKRSDDNSSRHTRPRRLLGFLTLALLASLLLTMAPLPFSLLSGVTGLVALVLLIPLIVRSFREGRPGMAVFTALIGIPATLMIITSALVMLVFYGPTSQLEECLSTAITQKAVAQCNADLQEAGATWLSDLFGG